MQDQAHAAAPPTAAEPGRDVGIAPAGDPARAVASAGDTAVAPAGDGARELACRRSLRVSRARRAAAALRRRRTLRGRRSAFVAAAGLFMLSAGAVAQQAAPGSGGAGGPGADVVAAAQKALGVRADGVAGPLTRSATKRFQRANGLTVDGIIGPETLKALGVAVDTAQGQPAAADVLARIAQCESSGDPAAISADGRYRGKYQFDRATWKWMGGTGDPAAAAEADQDAIAAKLLAQAGTSPWPNCA